jgi:hypothetical protein
MNKAVSREKICAMSDQLGEIMYAKDDDKMWELWEAFQHNWCYEPFF